MRSRALVVMTLVLLPAAATARGPKLFVYQSGGGHLGVQVLELTDQLREHLGVDRGAGVLVSEVAPDSPAAAAGLQAGDVLVAVAGERVASYWDLVSAVQSSKPGEDVEVRFVRERSEETVTAKLAERPQGAFTPPSYQAFKQLWPRGLPGPGYYFNPPDGDDTADDLRQELRRLKERFEDLERRLERLPGPQP